MRWVCRVALHGYSSAHGSDNPRCVDPKAGSAGRVDELVSSKRPTMSGVRGKTIIEPERPARRAITTGDRRDSNPRLVTVPPHSSALVRQRIRAAVTRSGVELRPPDDARQKPIRIGNSNCGLPVPLQGLASDRVPCTEPVPLRAWPVMGAPVLSRQCSVFSSNLAELGAEPGLGHSRLTTEHR